MRPDTRTDIQCVVRSGPFLSLASLIPVFSASELKISRTATSLCSQGSLGRLRTDKPHGTLPPRCLVVSCQTGRTNISLYSPFVHVIYDNTTPFKRTLTSTCCHSNTMYSQISAPISYPNRGPALFDIPTSATFTILLSSTKYFL